MTCEQIVTVADDMDPVMSCPGDLEAVCDIGEQPAYADYASFISAGGSASDNCQIDESSFMLQSEVSDGNSCPETVIRIYYVADLCGNGVTCEQVITIDDEIDPMMSCPSELTAVCDISEQPAYADFASFVGAGGSASDNCAINESSFTLQSEISDGNSCPETITRTYYVEDLCGNQVTCEQLIVINDIEAPIIDGPNEVLGTCTIGEFPPYQDYADFIADGGDATDNCTLVESSFALQSESSDGNLCPEIFTRIYQISDQCGNVSTFEQEIIIDDDEDPILLCPNNESAVCDASEIPVFTSFDSFQAAGGSASDNCGLDISSFTLQSEVSNGNTCPEIVLRTYFISDNCGNGATCVQEIIVSDDILPEMTCPPNLSAICDASEHPAYTSLAQFIGAGGTASDNCGINESSFFLQSQESDGNTCPETITRTYYIEDLCGNPTSCTQTVVINDDVNPEMTCPGDLTGVCSIDEIPAYKNYQDFINNGGSASDNCEINQFSFDLLSEVSDGNSCPETITRTYYIEDLCGNSASCTQVIVIKDDEAPSFESIPDLTFNCSIDEYPPFTSLDEYINAGFNVDDNCQIDPASFTLVSENADGASCPETYTRIYSVADLCGNQSTVSQNILVSDIIPPTINAPEGATFSCPEELEAPFISFDEFISAGGDADDNCSINPTTFALISESNDGLTCPTTITRIYVIYDYCGNSATTEQLITINDKISPEMFCPPERTGICSISEVSAYQNYAQFLAAGGSAEDNCGINESTFTLINQSSNGEKCPEVITRTYQIADNCGNTATCTVEVTILDDIAPVITCPSDLTGICSPNEQPAYLNLTQFINAGGSVSDNCEILNGSFQLIEETSDGNTCPEIITRVYQISDICGNTASCSQNVTINDEVPPIFTSNPDITTSCLLGDISPFESINDYKSYGGNISDNCGLDPNSFMMLTEESDGNTCPETITRIYIVSDYCGNTATIDHNITIDDLISPILTCPPTEYGICSSDEAPVYLDLESFIQAGGTASDNCSLDESSFTLLAEDTNGSTCPEILTRTYSIKDQCGNEAICTQMIIVNDLVPPIFTNTNILEGQCSIDDFPPYEDIQDFIDQGGILEDNCGIDPFSFSLDQELEAPDSCPKLYGRVYSVSDLCGNITTFTQSILIDDTIAPEMNCPNTATGVCSSEEIDILSTYEEYLEAGGTVDENCVLDESSFAYDGDIIVSNTCPQIINRIYSISDVCGNIGTCVQEIVVNDEIAPEINSPNNNHGDCDVAEYPPYTSFEDWVADGGGADDNCAVDPNTFALVQESTSSSTCPLIVTRIYVIADYCGNTATSNHTVTINDDTPPSITCPPDINGICSIDENEAATTLDQFILFGGSVSDNCSIDPTSFLLVEEIASQTACPTIIERIYQISDMCGNTATCSQTIVANDEEAPQIVLCPTDITLQCDMETNQAAIDSWLSNFEVIDNCTIQSIENNYQVPNGPCEGVGVTVVEFTAIDECNNVTSCTASLTIIDTIPPIADDLVDMIIDSLSELPPIDVTVVTGVSDLCDASPTIIWSSDEFETNSSCSGNSMTITRTYQVIDCSGNITEVVQTFIMDDDPILIAVEKVNVTCFGGDDGSIDISVTGGLPPYTYDWSNDIYDGEVSLENLVAGTYSVTVTDDNNCTQEKVIQITQPTQDIDVSISPAAPIICEGSSITLSANIAFGNAPFDYEWIFGNSSVGTTTLVASDPGIYTVIITDVTGCSATDEIELQVIPNVVIDPIGPLSGCEYVVLDSITGSNLSGSQAYFTQSNGNGSMFNHGDTIWSATTLYVYDATGTTPNCTDEVEVEIQLNEGPSINNPGDQFVCESYFLPAINGTNLSQDVAYYTLPNGQGNVLQEGDEITENSTIYIYDPGVDCAAQEFFTITIIVRPEIDPIDDVIACDSFILPIITGQNLTGNEMYYSGPNGSGTAFSAGTEITNSIDLYIFDGGTSCNDEEFVSIVIHDTPILTDPSDILVCNYYILPIIQGSNLTGSEGYFTESNGAGVQYFAGDTIFEDLTLFIYDINENCIAEVDVAISIVETPILEPLDDVVTCDFYVLPEIMGDNLTGNEGYFNAPSGLGTAFQPGDTIFSTIILYLFDQAGTCTDQDQFTVTVGGAPDIFPPAPITACGYAVLPEILGVNLGGNAAYFTEPLGGGTVYFSGDTVISSSQLYIYIEAGSCADEELIDITILPEPLLDEPADVSACDEYILLEITGSELTGNEAYYTGIEGSGISLQPGDTITSSLLLYIYDANTLCSNQVDMMINISPTPILDDIANVESCESYVLPEISGSFLNTAKYFSSADGQGDIYLPGDIITSSQTLFVYDINNGCSDEISFDIIILETPQLNDIEDVIVCDEFILPEITGTNLSGDQSYSDELGGNGNTYYEGDTVKESIELFVYDSNGPCVDEITFNITIDLTPELDQPQDVSACDAFVLPEITGENLTGNEGYFQFQNGQGLTYQPGDIVTTNSTIFVFDENGNCYDEKSFVVEITLTPELNLPLDETVCAFYILPEIVGVNLSENVSYYTSPQGSGMQYNPGDTLFNSIELYIYDEVNGCVDEIQFSIEILDGPNVNDLPDVEVCVSYVLPEIEGINLTSSAGYFSSPNGMGIEYEVGDVISANSTIYIYDAVATCFDEEIFNILITGVPVLNPIPDVTACDYFVLTAINGSNLSGNEHYYSQQQGLGDTLYVGDTIFSNTVLYAFDYYSDCNDEEELNIEILSTPILEPLDDVVVCDYYVLPEIIGNNLFDPGYFTGPQGSGEQLQESDTIWSSSEIFIYDENAICSDEVSFEVNFTPAPSINPIDPLISCEFVIVPIIIGQNLSGAQAYYTESDGNGSIIEVGDTIFESINLFAYDAAGGCTTEVLLEIEVLATPIIDPLFDVIVCDFYVLPEITGTNIDSYIYSSLPFGNGETFLVGDTIWSPITIYIEAQNGICTDNEEITIDFSGVPDIDPMDDVESCDYYILPEITGSNLTGNESYFSEAGGLGTLYEAGDTIFLTTNLFIYDVAGSCDDEVQFTVTINNTPEFFDISNVEICDFYVLPVIQGENLNNPIYSSNPGGAGTIYSAGDTIWNVSTIFISDANGDCVATASFNILQGANPMGTIEGDSSVCFDEGLQAELTIVVSGSFPIMVDLYKNGEFAEAIEILSSPIVLLVGEPGVYTIENMSTSDDCSGITIGSATVIGLESINVSDPLVECSIDGLSYTVSFEITGGVPSSFMVNDVLVNVQGVDPYIYSETFVVGSGSYSYTIFDENMCNTVIISGDEPNCECETQIGEMDPSLIEFCDTDQVAVGIYDDTNQVLEDDDGLVFILHDGTADEIGSIIETNTVPEFGFDPSSMSLDVVYYISAVVGNAGNPIDFNDPCLGISSTPVIYHSTPTALIDGNLEDCEGSLISVPVNLTGVGPWTLVYEINGSEFIEVGITQSPFFITFTVTETTDITLVSVSNDLCAGEATGAVNVNIVDELSAEVLPEVEICNLALKGSTVNFAELVLGGDTNGIWSDIDNSGASGIFPILDFDGVTPGDYIFEYTIGVNSDCGSITYSVVVTVIECVCPVVAVEAPDDFCVGLAINLNDYVIGDPGSWQLIGNSNMNISIDGNNQLITSGSEGGTFELYFVLDDIDPDCPSDTTIFINIDEPVTAGDDLELLFCETQGADVDLNGLLINADLGGSWSLPDDLQDYYDVTSNVLELSDIPEGSYTLEYSVVSDYEICGDDTAEISLVIASLPSGVIDPVDSLNCETPNVVISVSEGSGNDEISFFWSTIDGNIITTPDTSVIIVNAPGDYYVLITDNTTNCSTIETVTVIGTPDFIVADAGEDQTLTCAQVVVMLDGSGSSEGDYVYQWLDGDGNVISGANGMYYETGTGGEYIIMVLNEETGCMNSDTVFVSEIINYPLAEIVDPSMLNCEIDEVLIDGSNSTVNEFVHYNWFNQNGELVAEDTLEFSTAQGGYYYLQVVDSTNMCESFDTIFVDENYDLPEVLISPDFVLDCITTEGTIEANILTNNTEYQWFDENGQELPIADLSFEIDSAGTYVIEVIDNLNGCITEKAISVGIDTIPVGIELEVVNPCDNPFGGSIIITAEGNSDNLNYELSNGNTSSTGLFSNLQAGDYSVTVTGENGCEASEEATLYATLVLDLYAGGDIDIDLGESVQLNAETSVPEDEVFSIYWYPENGTLSCIECYDPLATPYYTTEYVVTMEDIYGCVIEDEIIIRVDRTTKLYAPNIFTPDDDGINDKWILYSAENVDLINEIYVYNRWGEKVWENFNVNTGDESEGWDGTFKGEAVNPAVFAWYAIVTLIDGSKVTVKGDVTVMR